MAPRPSWHGYLKLSLVTCPVAMLPATSEAEKVRFHTLNRATGNRVHARYVDAETGKPVDDEDKVKGYEREDGRYVMAHPIGSGSGSGSAPVRPAVRCSTGPTRGVDAQGAHLLAARPAMLMLVGATNIDR